MENRWTFPHGKKLTPRGVNDPAINSFLDNMIDSLTREVIQNSLDAKDRESTEPVEVDFSFKEIETYLIPGIKQLREFALPRAQKFWTEKNNQGTLRYLDNFKSRVESKSVRVLKISDYNTYGLNEKSYDALVLGNGYTEKIDENAAGSKGIGKAAPFAISDLRLVFYNTIPKKSKPKHVGVLNFVSFHHDEDNYDEITQERALYQQSDLDYIPGQINFGFKERENTQTGTDLFIVGLKEIDEDWEMKILLSAVNNFLVSILNNKLVVKVNNRILNSENVKSIIELLENFPKTLDERRIFDNTQNYFDALTNPNRLEFQLDEKFMKYPFIHDLNDGKLILLKREKNANRSILQTRISGMKIYDRKSISGNINFTGVFRATGQEFDKFLKGLENTNHTGWSEDQASIADRKNAKNLLKDLYDWFKQQVKESFEVSADSIIDAFGVSDFLPLVSQKDGVDDEPKESGIQNKIDKVQIKRNIFRPNTSTSSEIQDDNLDNIIEGLGFEDGDDSELSYKKDDRKKKVGKKSLASRLRNLLKKEELVIVDSEFVIKNIALNSECGEYRFILKPRKSMKQIELKFSYIGEDGMNTNVVLLTASSTTNKLKLTDSVLRVSNVVENKIITIDVKVDSELLVKMEGKIYEVKS